MSDGVEQRVAELYGKIGKLFDEVPAKVCLDVLVNAAANVLCQVHIDKDKARIDGWNFGKNLDMVIAEKFDATARGWLKTIAAAMMPWRIRSEMLEVGKCS